MTNPLPVSPVTIIGAGLAGSEAAWQLAQRGFRVDLFEMRPQRQTEAHNTADFAELGCSNSFGAQSVDRAQGLLKEELRRLGSLIVNCAEQNALPAGGALAVGRESFSADVTSAILSHPNICVHRTEITDLPAGPTIIASGPLTSDALAKRIGELALTVKNFDNIHSHGRLCAVRGFAELYAATKDPHWLDAAQRDWKIFMDKYRLPTGGVKEVLVPSCARDEGCSESDWLRLNLSLWQLTGKGCYLDESERCLKAHFIYNQYPNGGAGHRVFHQIDGRPMAFKDSGEEAWWCCSMHWARATADVARLAVTGGEQGPSINLMIDCAGSVAGPGGKWRIVQREIEDGLHITLQSPVETKATVRIHRPAWARDGARIETPAALSLRETKDAWFVEGTWKGTQKIVVHLPTALRSEEVPGGVGVLLRGHDLMVAHRNPANAWLMNTLPGIRPVVRWTAATAVENGRVQVPASLKTDADPKRPEQWKQLELAPLRAVAGEPHEAAWFSFQLLPRVL